MTNARPEEVGTGAVVNVPGGHGHGNASHRQTPNAPPDDARFYVRGPGPRPSTTGLEDAGAPPWWWAEAERVVLALVDSGHQVTSDDLHEKFADEPSATGAAYGALFARLARAGRIREVGMVRSRRPEARRRRLILWGAP